MTLRWGWERVECAFLRPLLDCATLWVSHLIIMQFFTLSLPCTFFLHKVCVCCSHAIGLLLLIRALVSTVIQLSFKFTLASTSPPLSGGWKYWAELSWTHDKSYSREKGRERNELRVIDLSVCQNWLIWGAHTIDLTYDDDEWLSWQREFQHEIFLSLCFCSVH